MLYKNTFRVNVLFETANTTVFQTFTAERTLGFHKRLNIQIRFNKIEKDNILQNYQGLFQLFRKNSSSTFARQVRFPDNYVS